MAIDFSLSPEQEDLQKLARDFVQAEMTPEVVRHHDETGEFPRAILQKAFELGLMNGHIPEEYGGLGLSAVDGTLIGEEIAAGCTGIGTAMEANNLAQAPVIVGGNDEQKKRFLAPMLEKLTLRGLRRHRAGRGQRRAGHQDHAPARWATTTSSTAARCGSPTPASPTGTSSWPTPTRTRAPGA